MKETGKQGLTSQVRDYLKLAEKLYNIYAVRNHQGLGSNRGRPDYEIVMMDREALLTLYFIGLELKSPKWRGKLNKYQQSHRDRIEKASGEYHIITSLDQLHQIFLNRGYDRIKLNEIK